MLERLRRGGILIALLTGCSLESAGTAEDLPLDDTGAIDTSVSGDAIFPTDEGVADSSVVDSSIEDTTVADTAAPDTHVADTFVPDTAPVDTGMPDTIVVVDTAPDAPVGMPSLIGESGPLAASAQKFNLATEGTLDWAHWGHGGSASTWNRKSGGTALVKGAIGGALPWATFPTEISWTGGTPTASVTDSRWGIYHDNNGESFAFDAEGDPTVERTLRVYVTWNNCTGTVEARLSDAMLSWSGPLPPPGGTGMGIQPAWYQFKFKPAATGGKVQIRVTKTNNSGYMGILAATLK